MLSSFRRSTSIFPYTREGGRSTRAGPDKPMAWKASEQNSLRGLSPEADSGMGLD